MNTERLMEIALEMAELGEIPGDSAVHHPGRGIRRLLVGIDLRAPELAMAKGLGYDAVLTHHPVGVATLNFHRVLDRHVDQMIAAGVPTAVARAAVDETAEARRVLDSMTNYDHDPSIARLLDMPYLNIHTPLDEIGRRRIADAAASLPAESTVADLVQRLTETFGEFRSAATRVEVLVGRGTHRLGRVVVSHGAGTNGGYPVGKAYFEHGVDTLLYIHCRPDDARRLEAEFGVTKSLVVTGHIASDSVGINPYVDRLRREGLRVTTASGILSGAETQ
ncbi:MAG: Nif3-like dinuclear metal center hexameric protein [Candidatus Bipolaricaulota bacterium]|nr:Nif3-like dinuclear metal center hexameric protein [Candidatus Bipolaricaulota bacterium]